MGWQEHPVRKGNQRARRNHAKKNRKIIQKNIENDIRIYPVFALNKSQYENKKPGKKYEDDNEYLNNHNNNKIPRKTKTKDSFPHLVLTDPYRCKQKGGKKLTNERKRRRVEKYQI